MMRENSDCASSPGYFDLEPAAQMIYEKSHVPRMWCFAWINKGCVELNRGCVFPCCLRCVKYYARHVWGREIPCGSCVFLGRKCIQTPLFDVVLCIPKRLLELLLVFCRSCTPAMARFDEEDIDDEFWPSDTEHDFLQEMGPPPEDLGPFEERGYDAGPQLEKQPLVLPLMSDIPNGDETPFYPHTHQPRRGGDARDFAAS